MLFFLFLISAMWADEEEPQWGADDSETPAEAAPAAEGGAGGEGAPPAEGGEGAPAGDQPVEEEKKKRDVNQPVYFRYVNHKLLTAL